MHDYRKFKVSVNGRIARTARPPDVSEMVPETIFLTRSQ
jgi:hypothetical protein